MIKYLLIYAFWKMVLILLAVCTCVELNIQDANIINDSDGWLIFSAGFIAHYITVGDKE